MKILWFTWKDLTHPLAGGAEVVNEELAKRLVADGHEVTFLVGAYKGCQAEETSPHGFKIIRGGNRYNQDFYAYRYYKKHLKGWADLVIDEVNTMPYFAKFYVTEPNIIFAHQLCRKIWFYELPQPLSTIGYLIEPLYLRILSDRKAITISESTKQDLLRVGFKSNAIHVISEGIQVPPLRKLPPKNIRTKKQAKPTMLSFGAMRQMKRTLDQLKAYELAKQQIPDLQFWLAGDSAGKYGQKVLQAIQASPYAADITYHGRVPQAKKWQLMQQSHFITVTSVKEGWGLIVTEANSQGTPAIVYNVDGLRDSVRDGKTGLITDKNTPNDLAVKIITLQSNQKQYDVMRQGAWQWSKEITFEQSYHDFKEVLAKEIVARD